MEHTVGAGRAAVAETGLDVVVEEESGLSVAHPPAAAAPNTTNSEIADKRLVGCMAKGVITSGYVV